MGRHAPVGRHGKDIAQPVAADRGTQPRVGTIDFVAGHPRRGNLRGHGPVDQRDRQGGFGGETLLVFSGIPASAQRTASSVHDLGRYSARSIKAWPRGAA
jgi:hypothetical protein